MSVVVSNLDRRVQALCEYAGHLIDVYDETEHDPGAEVCRTEGCSSAIYVGLLRASRRFVDGKAEIVCNCESPQWCACQMEQLRLNATKLIRSTNNRLRRIIEFDFPGHEDEVYEILGCEVEW